MKIFIVSITEFREDTPPKVTIKAFSTQKNAIDFVNALEINDFVDRVFGDEIPIIENHHNGYLHAYLNSDYHEVFVDFSEVTIDSNDEYTII